MFLKIYFKCTLDESKSNINGEKMKSARTIKNTISADTDKFLKNL